MSIDLDRLFAAQEHGLLGLGFKKQTATPSETSPSLRKSDDRALSWEPESMAKFALCGDKPLFSPQASQVGTGSLPFQLADRTAGGMCDPEAPLCPLQMLSFPPLEKHSTSNLMHSTHQEVFLGLSKRPNCQHPQNSSDEIFLKNLLGNCFQVTYVSLRYFLKKVMYFLGNNDANLTPLRIFHLSLRTQNVVQERGTWVRCSANARALGNTSDTDVLCTM